MTTQLQAAGQLDAEAATLFEKAHRIAAEVHEASLLAGTAPPEGGMLMAVAENAAVREQAMHLKRQADRLRASAATRATVTAPDSGPPAVSPPTLANPRAAEDALVAEILAATGSAGKPSRATSGAPAAAIEPADTTDAEALAAEIIASAAVVEALS